MIGGAGAVYIIVRGILARFSLGKGYTVVADNHLQGQSL